MKRIVKIIPSLLIVFLLSNCGGDDEIEVNNTKIFEVVVNQEFETDNSDDYLIISKLSGDFIEYTQIESGQNYTFGKGKDLEDEFIIISLIRVLQNGSSKQFFVKIFNKIPAGDEWFLSQFVPTNTSALNYFPVEININNYPSEPGTNKIMSSRKSESSTYKNGIVEEGQMRFGTQFSDGDSDLLICYSFPRSSPSTFYHLIKKPQPAIYNLDFLTDFKELDNSIDITLESNLTASISVSGFDDSSKITPELIQGNVFASLGGYDLRTLNFGYLDGYHLYRTIFKIERISGAKVEYSKIGLPPTKEDFDLPSSDFAIIEKSFDVFQLEIDGDFDYLIGKWQGRPSNDGNSFLDIEYSAPLNDFSGTQEILLPDEIISSYPELDDLFNIEFSSTTCVKRMDDKSYEGLISERFRKSQYAIPETELYSVSRND
ncbi:MAG: hypothetical protein RIB71_04220 [Imperialibacter sp.]|uniref:hypothetical protein n=1 Tax=Imperialibacter sp. TaxID=2038411 RepID=UPI0032EC7DFE